MLIFEFKSFRTRVARRIFFLFILCALLPVSVLAAVSYLTVHKQLMAQSRERIRQETKAVSVSIYERMLFFRSELRSTAAIIGERPAVREAGSRSGAPAFDSHFIRLGILDKDGYRPISGNGLPPPAPNLVQEDHLKTGNALLLPQRVKGGIRLYMLLQMPAEANSWIVGEIDNAYLWEAAERRPPGAELFVIDRVYGLLFSSVPYNPLLGEIHFPARQERHTGQFEWADDRQTYLANFTSIHLMSNFLNPDWVVVLSAPRTAIFAPMAAFKFSFPLLIFIAVGLVFVLSLVQIRRQLNPMDKLREATEHITAGRFGHRVEIASHDEFEELGDAFNEMSQKLKENQELLVRSSKMATMGQMAAGLVHELKQPLSGMSSQIQLLRMDAGEGQAPRLDRVIEGLERMNGIMNRFSAFSRISKETMGPVSLPEVIERVGALLDIEMRNQKIAFTVDHQKDLPMLRGDAQSLEQAFSNLLVNAVHALDGRTDGDRQITVTTYQWAGKVIVDVADNGCGMSKKVQSRIFDPFFTTKDSDKGTGLGMAIVESILHDHGATIDLESTVDVGTRFTLSFPVGSGKDTP